MRGYPAILIALSSSGLALTFEMDPDHLAPIGGVKLWALSAIELSK